MSNQKNISVFLIFTALLPTIVLADSFLISDQVTANTTQIMNGDDEVGVVEFGGSIRTTVDGQSGIESSGVRASISNRGFIGTKGVGAVGISFIASHAVLNNFGSINTTEDGGVGIHIETTGPYATIMNRGSIETGGVNAYAITSRSTNVTILNDGLISTTGFSARAIESRGSYAHISNNGTIMTTGDAATAVYMAEDDSTLINNGKIVASGLGAHGIEMSGINSVVTNYGQITATGNSSFAVLGGSGKQTLNIMSGSRIAGRISLEDVGDNDEVNFFGADGSASITIENVEYENIRIFNSNAILIGDRIVYVDPTISAFSMRNLSSMTNATHSSVAQRFTVVSSSGSMDQIKTNPTTLSEEKSTIWVNTFIQRDQSDPEEHIQANESHLAGVVIGHERLDAVNPFGFLGGVARSDTTSSSNRRESDSFFLGAYGRHDAHSVQFTGSLLFGRREHQLQRQVLDNLNGSMTAIGRTRGLFVSPSISISGTNSTLNSFGIQPSATITYSLERIKGYSETGTDQNNFQFGDQKIEALSTRLQIEKTQTMSRGEFRVRAGVHSRNTRSRDVMSRTNGTEFKINSQPDDRAAGLFAGVQADIRLTGPLRLKLTAEYGKLGGSEKFTNGSLVIFTPF